MILLNQLWETRFYLVTKTLSVSYDTKKNKGRLHLSWKLNPNCLACKLSFISCDYEYLGWQVSESCINISRKVLLSRWTLYNLYWFTHRFVKEGLVVLVNPALWRPPSLCSGCLYIVTWWQVHIVCVVFINHHLLCSTTACEKHILTAMKPCNKQFTPYNRNSVYMWRLRLWT